MTWFRVRWIALLGLLAFLSCFGLFYVLRILTVNVPIGTPWVLTSVRFLLALPIISLLSSLLSVRFDRSKWLAWVVLLMSGLLCVWVFLLVGMRF